MSLPEDNLVRVALIEKEIGDFRGVFSKLDIAIEKLSGVSSDVSRMLAVHEERINHNGRTTEDIFKQMEHHQTDVHGALQEDIKEIHSRVTTVNRELLINISTVTEKLSDNITSSEHKIMNSIGELKTLITADKEKLEIRMSALERWRWMMIGAFILIGGILSYFEAAHKTLIK